MNQKLEDAMTIIDRVRRHLKPNNGPLSDSDKKRYVAELELALQKLEEVRDDEG